MIPQLKYLTMLGEEPEKPFNRNLERIYSPIILYFSFSGLILIALWCLIILPRCAIPKNNTLSEVTWYHVTQYLLAYNSSYDA